MSIYLNNPWRPVRSGIIKDDVLTSVIHDKGYQVRPFLSADQLDKVRAIFNEHHDFSDKDGGMFYSVYSKNKAYRKAIFDAAETVLNELLGEYFHDHRVMLYSYVVKTSGSKSEFSLHQDTTGLDEWKYSPLNIWIPLTDVTVDNGCMALLPYSHRFFSPYRSIAFPPPFTDVQETLKTYLEPIEMKAGEGLFFDNRLVHNSFANNSGQVRAALVIGLFPKEAVMTTCYKPEPVLGGQVELIEHDDRFLMEYENFLDNCHIRPDTGKSIGWVEDPYAPAITEDEFLALCAKYDLHPNERTKAALSALKCDFIHEPI